MRGTQGRPRFDSHFSTEKIALIIAINVYEHGWENLDTCETDGKRIADYFKSNDFQVKTLFGKDATRENIMRNIQKIDVCKTAVIYFAGHGISGKFGPALVPVDAQHNSHDIVDKISQDSIQSFSRRTRAHGVVFILDCCFGGDFCVKLRGTERPSFCLNQMEKSRIVLSASMKGREFPMPKMILRAHLLQSHFWIPCMMSVFRDQSSNYLLRPGQGRLPSMRELSQNWEDFVETRAVMCSCNLQVLVTR